MHEPSRRSLIAIAGKKGAGKDTLASFFIAAGYRQYRFADPLKQMLKTMLAFTDATPMEIDRMIDGDLKEVPSYWFGNKTPREAMQYLGTEWRDHLAQDLWMRIFKFRSSLYDGPQIITDCRFVHEFAEIRKLGGTVIKIHRDVAATVGATHASENEIDQIEADINVFNDGTIDDLRVAAAALIEEFK